MSQEQGPINRESGDNNRLDINGFNYDTRSPVRGVIYLSSTPARSIVAEPASTLRALSIQIDFDSLADPLAVIGRMHREGDVKRHGVLVNPSEGQSGVNERISRLHGELRIVNNRLYYNDMSRHGTRVYIPVDETNLALGFSQRENGVITSPGNTGIEISSGAILVLPTSNLGSESSFNLILSRVQEEGNKWAITRLNSLDSIPEGLRAEIEDKLTGLDRLTPDERELLLHFRGKLKHNEAFVPGELEQVQILEDKLKDPGRS